MSITLKLAVPLTGLGLLLSALSLTTNGSIIKRYQGSTISFYSGGNGFLNGPSIMQVSRDGNLRQFTDHDSSGSVTDDPKDSYTEIIGGSASGYTLDSVTQDGIRHSFLEAGDSNHFRVLDATKRKMEQANKEYQTLRALFQ